MVTSILQTKVIYRKRKRWSSVSAFYNCGIADYDDCDSELVRITEMDCCDYHVKNVNNPVVVEVSVRIPI